MFPSMPQDGDRDAWDADPSRETARSGSRSSSGFYAGAPQSESGVISGSTGPDGEDGDSDDFEIPEVPVRRQLSVAIAGFAALLGVGLILGAQTSGPDARTPYAIVIFGVQILFVLAWTMAMRPPAPGLVAGLAVVAGVLADYLAVTTDPPRLLPMIVLVLVATGLAVGAQFAMRTNRLRVRDALATTVLIISGVVAFAALIALTRKPVGTQAVLVCLSATALALTIARLTDAVFPRPRIAPQVARGATGVILGAMLGTLGAAVLGSVLVLPFTPAKGAVLGLVAAGIAVLVDLAVNFSEAGRNMAGAAPTFWLARHMQGPLGAFALVAPVAYALTVFFLS